MKTLFTTLLSAFLIININAQSNDLKPFHKWALTPPMGWNSWDCFGPSVVESEVKANADYMAENLLEYGWEYVVVDIRWYIDNQTTGHYNAFDNSDFIYDEYGRYLPSPKRFPSSVNGAGFKPLADYVHAKGLKFGIHIMRGVPKKAVTEKLPILGSDKTAADIYSTAYECTWLQDNYTVDGTKEGAQEYYNSIVNLYASWGVDYIKVDDLSRPYHDKEIEFLRNAIDQTGRPILLSMSPGATPLDEHEHAKNHANLWRTIDDFWDNWSQLNYSFGKCADWAPYISPGAWPDADMLPLGHLSIRGERGADRQSNFTEDEQYTLMTLWTMFKSPLMFGGHLPDNNAFTDALITNEEVLEIHKTSVNNKEWYNEDGAIIWTADDPTNGDKLVALFNNGGDDFVNTKDLLYRSGTVSTLTDGFGVNIDIELPAGGSQLYLVVNDGGDGISYDHADWIDPTVYLDNGDSVKLSDQNWEYASAGWGTIQQNKNISGGTLNIKGIEYDKGVGTHSQSVILYAIPENAIRFKSFAGLDLGGTSQTGSPTVEFMVSVIDPTLRDVNVNNAIANSGRISRTIQNQGVHLSADITDAEKLYLVVTDAGDNYNYDHGDWINPAIYTANGDSVLLTSLDWVSATSGWDQVKKNTSLDNNALKVNGTTYANGLGVNSYSIIEYDLPEGYITFKTFCGFDDEVINADNGVTMEFLVFTQDPSNKDFAEISIDLTELGFTGNCTIRDVWTKTDLGTYSGSDFSASIIGHGAGLYRISGNNRSSETTIELTPSKTQIKEGETLSITINVSNSPADAALLTGWVQLYQNDSLVANLEIDDAGNITFETPDLKEGTIVFIANYSGNTIYTAKQSGSISIEVMDPSTAVFTPTNSDRKIWVDSIAGNNYLNGIQSGDQVSVFDTQGRKIEQFIAQSDKKELKYNGVVVIQIISNNQRMELKAVL